MKKLKYKATHFVKKIAVVLTICTLFSCGTEYKVENITKSYCKCIDNANGLKKKAICLKKATSEYNKVLKVIPKEELSDFKNGYKKGLKECK